MDTFLINLFLIQIILKRSQHFVFIGRVPCNFQSVNKTFCLRLSTSSHENIFPSQKQFSLLQPPSKAKLRFRVNIQQQKTTNTFTVGKILPQSQSPEFNFFFVPHTQLSPPAHKMRAKSFIVLNVFLENQH